MQKTDPEYLRSIHDSFLAEIKGYLVFESAEHLDLKLNQPSISSVNRVIMTMKKWNPVSKTWGVLYP